VGRIKKWFLSIKDRTLWVKLVTLLAGWGGWVVMSVIFDDTIYPAVIIKFGPIKGGIIMTVGSIITSYLQIIIYDFIGKDLFGFEVIKKNSGRSRLADFVFLSFWDPFLGVAFMRANGRKGMNARDWKNFAVAIAISNLGWTLWCYVATIVFSYFTGLTFSVCLIADNTGWSPLLTLVGSGLRRGWRSLRSLLCAKSRGLV